MNHGALPEPRPAATVMLVRDRAGIEVYLARRSVSSRFMPGVYVFPGGALEDADADPATIARTFGRSSESALAVAAARELFEEAGVLLACGPDGEAARLSALERRALRHKLRDAPFAQLLEAAGLFIDLRLLEPYSRWITPVEEPIRFDTHFFLARAPENQVPEADARELHDGRWFTPAGAMERADLGEIEIIFPTRKHLERLSAFTSVEALLEHARSRTIEPLLVQASGGGTFRLPAGVSDW